MSQPESAGRRLQGSAYPDDNGEPDARLAAALAAYAADGGRYVDVLAALLTARLLVPVVAVLGEAETGEDGLVRDKSSDMAVVLMQRADGRKGLLAFSSTGTMRGWDAEARPVPVAARLAAQAALQEGADALVVDIAGPVRVAVEREDLHALAAGWQLTRVDGAPAWLRPAE